MNKLNRMVLCMVVLAVFMSGITGVSAADYANHWAAGTIRAWIQSGLINEETDDFRPDRNITRSEFLKFILTAKNADIPNTLAPDFNDVSKDDTYYKYIAYAYTEGIVTGYPDGSFKPNHPISRQDAYVLLARAFNLYYDGSGEHMSFSDMALISPYALKDTLALVENGYVTGYADNTVRPLNPISNAEAITIIDRIITNPPDNNSYVRPDEPLSFYRNYPRAQPSTMYGYINVYVRFNRDCTVYYLLEEKSLRTRSLESVRQQMLSDSSYTYSAEAGELAIAALKADVGKEYNIYVFALDQYGSTDVVKIENQKPMAFASGYGSEESPYVITTEEHLSNIRYFTDKNFVLGNDITVTLPFVPVQDTFSGTLDGNGKRITHMNFYIGEKTAGMFCRIRGTVKNLCMDNVEITADRTVGALCGELTDTGVIENCMVSGNVSANGGVGGIAGENNGKITNCVCAANVYAKDYAGGITGTNAGVLSNVICCADTVRADFYAGGLSAGNSGIIQNSVSAVRNIVDMAGVFGGRICVNTKGSLYNNYAWAETKTTFEITTYGTDKHNGLSVMLNTMKDKNFYSNILGFDFDAQWELSLPDETDTYLLPKPIGCAVPQFEKGKGFYAPIPIQSYAGFEQINNNMAGTYILLDNILLEPVKTGALAGYGINELDEGFSGIFDGNGKTVQITALTDGLSLGYSGIFTKLEEDALVCDLKIYALAGGQDVDAVYPIDGGMYTGSLAGVNYGKIRNIEADIGINSSTDVNSGNNIGGLVAVNYGLIYNADVTSRINVVADNSNIGGIAGYNEGIILNSQARTKTDISPASDFSGTNAGGIVGFNANGALQRCFASVNISASSCKNYAGGIAGMNEDAGIIACYAMGEIKSDYSPKDTSSAGYIGGITGLNSNSVVSDCYAGVNINARAYKEYAGGIIGYNMTGNLVNCYTFGTVYISARGVSRGGGLTGMSEGGFIASNCVAMKDISASETVKLGRVCASATEGTVLQNNFVYDKMTVNSRTAVSEDELTNGIAKTKDQIKLRDTYFASELEGGLAWEMYDASTGLGMWQWRENPVFQLPTLFDLPDQQQLQEIDYLK